MSVNYLESCNQSFANMTVFPPLESPRVNMGVELIDQDLSSMESPCSENNCREKIDQIVHQMEISNNNLGYGLGVAMKRSFEYLTSSLSSLDQSIFRLYHSKVYGDTELHCAILYGDQKGATILASQNELINSVNYEGETPLMIASKTDNPDIVNLLIKNGAQIDQRDSKERTALHHAVGKSIEIAQRLIDSGAEVSSTDFEKNNCIHYAAETGNLDIIKLSLKHQVSIDEFNAANLTPLMIAAEHRQFEAFKLLVDFGASTTKQASDQSPSVFGRALLGENDKIIDFLIQKKVWNSPVASTDEIHHKNWATEAFEKIVRKILLEPIKNIKIKKLKSSKDKCNIEITMEGRTYDLFEIFRELQWEAVRFDEDEYKLISFEFAGLEKIDLIIERLDWKTYYERYSFGTDYKKKYKDLNEIDKTLIYLFTKEWGYRINDLLAGIDAHYNFDDLDYYQWLPRIGFFVNALNKIHPEVPEHFTCRGQSYFDRKNKLKNPRFISLSRIYNICRMYATYGRSVEEYGGGNVVFFKNISAYDISGLSSVAKAAEYITLPRIITYANEHLDSSTYKTRGGLEIKCPSYPMQIYFGQFHSTSNVDQSHD